VRPRCADKPWYAGGVGTWERGALALEELKRLSLTPEEGFVLSRLDARLSTSEVAALTGLPPERAIQILERLTEVGAVRSDAPSIETPSVTADEARFLDEQLGSEVSDTEVEGAPDEEPGDSEAAEESDPDPAPANEAGYRKIYETQLRTLSQGERISKARTATDSELMALCLDPDARVLNGVLENPKCGLQHARFAARWHPTAAGLEAIAQRGGFFIDPQLQRLLLRNTHSSELLTKRVLGGKRMLDAYKVSVDTDVPERARMFARTVLRSKFGTAQGEERAGLICATDGRVLAALAGLTLDGRATSILCARGYTSALFVQSLARFGSCPPQLLAHLLRQPLVRRQQHLKSMLLQHPNMPAEAKRRM
jgi:hypothetical protein